MNILQAKLNAKKEIKTEELEQKDSSYFIQLKKQIFLIIIITLGTLMSKKKNQQHFQRTLSMKKETKRKASGTRTTPSWHILLFWD